MINEQKLFKRIDSLRDVVANSPMNPREKYLVTKGILMARHVAEDLEKEDIYENQTT